MTHAQPVIVFSILVVRLLCLSFFFFPQNLLEMFYEPLFLPWTPRGLGFSKQLKQVCHDAGCLGVPAACYCIVCADVRICIEQTVIKRCLWIIFIAAFEPRLLPQLLLMTWARCHPQLEPTSTLTKVVVFHCQCGFFSLCRCVNPPRRRKYFCDLVYTEV